jgi:pimeloyl-ACP methyl ester carboxylesterase
MLNKRLSSISQRFFSRKIEIIRGKTNENTSKENMELRGIKLNSNYNDNPNMLFFVDYFDKPENWLAFFMNNQTLDYRNVYILNSPNFGNSDYNNQHDLESIEGQYVAQAVERFMWQEKLSTATLAGHGFGARTAFMMGCYAPEQVTGIAALDYSPLDYSNFDIVHRLQSALQSLNGISEGMRRGEMTRRQINSYIEENVEHPKMQALFKQNVKHVKDSVFDWDFNMELVSQNLPSLVNFKESAGLYPGRVNFIFPDISDYVFLNSHTNAMKKKAVSCGDYQKDIVTEMCYNDEPYLNHFFYEDKQLSESFAFKLNRFLHMYDGVNILLSSRRDVYERTFVPTRSHERKDKLLTDHFPNHFHHNWKMKQE